MGTNFDDEDFIGYLNDLVDSGRLESKELGITKLVIAKGYKVLTPKQKMVFDSVIATNTVDSCKLCAIDIPWCEMLAALDNGGYCSHCQHVKEKLERE